MFLCVGDSRCFIVELGYIVLSLPGVSLEGIMAVCVCVHVHGVLHQCVISYSSGTIGLLFFVHSNDCTYAR